MAEESADYSTLDDPASLDHFMTWVTNNTTPSSAAKLRGGDRAVSRHVSEASAELEFEVSYPDQALFLPPIDINLETRWSLLILCRIPQPRLLPQPRRPDCKGGRLRFKSLRIETHWKYNQKSMHNLQRRTMHFKISRDRRQFRSSTMLLAMLVTQHPKLLEGRRQAS